MGSGPPSPWTTGTFALTKLEFGIFRGASTPPIPALPQTAPSIPAKPCFLLYFLICLDLPAVFDFRFCFLKKIKNIQKKSKTNHIIDFHDLCEKRDPAHPSAAPVWPGCKVPGGGLQQGLLYITQATRNLKEKKKQQKTLSRPVGLTTTSLTCTSSGSPRGAACWDVDTQIEEGPSAPEVCNSSCQAPCRFWTAAPASWQESCLE